MSDPPTDPSGERAVRDLLVTAYTPALRSGRALRTYGVARALATHRGLDVLYVRFEAARARRGLPRDPGDRAARGRPLARGAAPARLRRGTPGGRARGVRARRLAAS